MGLKEVRFIKAINGSRATINFRISRKSEYFQEVLKKC